MVRHPSFLRKKRKRFMGGEWALAVGWEGDGPVTRSQWQRLAFQEEEVRKEVQRLIHGLSRLQPEGYLVSDWFDRRTLERALEAGGGGGEELRGHRRSSSPPETSEKVEIEEVIRAPESLPAALVASFFTDFLGISRRVLQEFKMNEKISIAGLAEAQQNFLTFEEIQEDSKRRCVLWGKLSILIFNFLESDKDEDGCLSIGEILHFLGSRLGIPATPEEIKVSEINRLSIYELLRWMGEKKILKKVLFSDFLSFSELQKNLLSSIFEVEGGVEASGERINSLFFKIAKNQHSGIDRASEGCITLPQIVRLFQIAGCDSQKVNKNSENAIGGEEGQEGEGREEEGEEEELFPEMTRKNLDIFFPYSASQYAEAALKISVFSENKNFFGSEKNFQISSKNFENLVFGSEPLRITKDFFYFFLSLPSKSRCPRHGADPCISSLFALKILNFFLKIPENFDFENECLSFEELLIERQGRSLGAFYEKKSFFGGAGGLFYYLSLFDDNNEFFYQNNVFENPKQYCEPVLSLSALAEVFALVGFEMPFKKLFGSINRICKGSRLVLTLPEFFQLAESDNAFAFLLRLWGTWGDFLAECPHLQRNSEKLRFVGLLPLDSFLFSWERREPLKVRDWKGFQKALAEIDVLEVSGFQEFGISFKNFCRVLVYDGAAARWGDLPDFYGLTAGNAEIAEFCFEKNFFTAHRNQDFLEEDEERTSKKSSKKSQKNKSKKEKKVESEFDIQGKTFSEIQTLSPYRIFLKFLLFEAANFEKAALYPEKKSKKSKKIGTFEEELVVPWEVLEVLKGKLTGDSSEILSSDESFLLLSLRSPLLLQGPSVEELLAVAQASSPLFAAPHWLSSALHFLVKVWVPLCWDAKSCLYSLQNMEELFLRLALPLTLLEDIKNSWARPQNRLFSFSDFVDLLNSSEHPGSFSIDQLLQRILSSPSASWKMLFQNLLPDEPLTPLPLPDVLPPPPSFFFSAFPTGVDLEHFFVLYEIQKNNVLGNAEAEKNLVFQKFILEYPGDGSGDFPVKLPNFAPEEEGEKTIFFRENQADNPEKMISKGKLSDLNQNFVLDLRKKKLVLNFTERKEGDPIILRWSEKNGMPIVQTLVDFLWKKTEKVELFSEKFECPWEKSFSFSMFSSTEDLKRISIFPEDDRASGDISPFLYSEGGVGLAFQRSSQWRAVLPLPDLSSSRRDLWKNENFKKFRRIGVPEEMGHIPSVGGVHVFQEDFNNVSFSGDNALSAQKPTSQEPEKSKTSLWPVLSAHLAKGVRPPPPPSSQFKELSKSAPIEFWPASWEEALVMLSEEIPFPVLGPQDVWQPPPAPPPGKNFVLSAPPTDWRQAFWSAFDICLHSSFQEAPLFPPGDPAIICEPPSSSAYSLKCAAILGDFHEASRRSSRALIEALEEEVDMPAHLLPLENQEQFQEGSRGEGGGAQTSGKKLEFWDFQSCEAVKLFEGDQQWVDLREGLLLTLSLGSDQVSLQESNLHYGQELKGLKLACKKIIKHRLNPKSSGIEVLYPPLAATCDFAGFRVFVVPCLGPPPLKILHPLPFSDPLRRELEELGWKGYPLCGFLPWRGRPEGEQGSNRPPAFRYSVLVGGRRILSKEQDYQSEFLTLAAADLDRLLPSSPFDCSSLRSWRKRWRIKVRSMGALVQQVKCKSLRQLVVVDLLARGVKIIWRQLQRHFYAEKLRGKERGSEDGKEPDASFEVLKTFFNSLDGSPEDENLGEEEREDEADKKSNSSHLLKAREGGELSPALACGTKLLELTLGDSRLTRAFFEQCLQPLLYDKFKLSPLLASRPLLPTLPLIWGLQFHLGLHLLLPLQRTRPQAIDIVDDTCKVKPCMALDECVMLLPFDKHIQSELLRGAALGGPGPSLEGGEAPSEVKKCVLEVGRLSIRAGLIQAFASPEMSRQLAFILSEVALNFLILIEKVPSAWSEATAGAAWKLSNFPCVHLVREFHVELVAPRLIASACKLISAEAGGEGHVDEAKTALNEAFDFVHFAHPLSVYALLVQALLHIRQEMFLSGKDSLRLAIHTAENLAAANKVVSAEEGREEEEVHELVCRLYILEAKVSSQIQRAESFESDGPRPNWRLWERALLKCDRGRGEGTLAIATCNSELARTILELQEGGRLAEDDGQDLILEKLMSWTLELASKALKIRVAKLGPSHGLTLQSRQQVGKVLEKLGRNFESLQIWEESVGACIREMKRRGMDIKSKKLENVEKNKKILVDEESIRLTIDGFLLEVDEKQSAPGEAPPHQDEFTGSILNSAGLVVGRLLQEVLHAWEESKPLLKKAFFQESVRNALRMYVNFCLDEQIKLYILRRAKRKSHSTAAEILTDILSSPKLFHSESEFIRKFSMIFIFYDAVQWQGIVKDIFEDLLLHQGGVAKSLVFEVPETEVSQAILPPHSEHHKRQLEPAPQHLNGPDFLTPVDLVFEALRWFLCPSCWTDPVAAVDLPLSEALNLAHDKMIEPASRPRGAGEPQTQDCDPRKWGEEM